MNAQSLVSGKIIIPFKYKGIRLNRFLAIAFIVVSAIGFFNTPDNYIFNYGYLFFGVGYIYLYFFMYSKAGLLIKNGVINVQPLGKRIVINEITEFKKFAGDYTLKSVSSKIIINTQLLDEDGLQTLDRILESVPEEYQREILV